MTESPTVIARLAQLGLDIPPIGRKRGRPRSLALDFLRERNPHLSERTIARLDEAYRTLSLLDEPAKERLLSRYTRPNGSLNVSGLQQHAAVLLALRRRTSDR